MNSEASGAFELDSGISTNSVFFHWYHYHYHSPLTALPFLHPASFHPEMSSFRVLSAPFPRRSVNTHASIRSAHLLEPKELCLLTFSSFLQFAVSRKTCVCLVCLSSLPNEHHLLFCWFIEFWRFLKLQKALENFLKLRKASGALLKILEFFLNFWNFLKIDFLVLKNTGKNWGSRSFRIFFFNFSVSSKFKKMF